VALRLRSARVNAGSLWYPDDRTKLLKMHIKRKGVRDTQTFHDDFALVQSVKLH
jgi:hypothetical protein